MQTCAGGATLIMKGAARLMKDASPTPTNLQSCLDAKSGDGPKIKGEATSLCF